MSIRYKGAVSFAVVAGLLGVGMFGAGAVSEASTVPYVKEEKKIIQGLPYQWSSNEFVIAHEAGNPNNTGANSLDNEVAFMSRNWGLAYVTDFVGSGGRAIQLAPHGQASWGAGAYANGRSYAQVELSRTKDPATFKKDYQTYVNLLRQLATEAGLPLTVDTWGSGIKTHEWVSDNLGGSDHRDPYNYLASWGITRSQFAKDIRTGVSGKVLEQHKDKQYKIEPATGKYVVPKRQAIKEVPTTKGASIAVYEKGQSFNIEGKVKNDGKTWLTYVSYAGLRVYVEDLSGVKDTPKDKPVTPAKPKPKPVAPVKPKPSVTDGGWYKETATFYPNTTINVRSGATTSSEKVAQYHAGQSVTYDSVKVSGGYVWVHYVSYSGQDRYLAVRTADDNNRGNLWGVIK